MATFLQHILLILPSREYNTCMLNMLIVVSGAVAVLALGEILKNKKMLKGESARKFVHILFGVYVAFWPYLLSRNQLLLLCVSLLPVIVASHFLHIFRAIHAGRERLVGEVLYAVAIAATAYIAAESWVFTTSILILALADGCAALVGKKHGHRTPKLYKNKTLAGALAFYVCAVGAIAVGYVLGDAHMMSQFGIVLFIWLPLFLSLVELVSPWGTDNLFVPLVSAYVLNVLIALY